MKCTITGMPITAKCDWCDRSKGCVELTIESTFFKDNLICQKCLRKIVAICNRQRKQNDDTSAIEKA